MLEVRVAGQALGTEVMLREVEMKTREQIQEMLSKAQAHREMLILKLAKGQEVLKSPLSPRPEFKEQMLAAKLQADTSVSGLVWSAAVISALTSILEDGESAGEGVA